MTFRQGVVCITIDIDIVCNFWWARFNIDIENLDATRMHTNTMHTDYCINRH